MSSIVGTSYSELTLLTDPGRKPGFLDLSGLVIIGKIIFVTFLENPKIMNL